MSGPARIPVAPDLAEALGREAERRGVAAEDLAAAALRAHLEGEPRERCDAVLLAAMEEVVEALGRVMRANLVISETQAEHLRCFLTFAPPMRPAEADAARANGNLLYDALCSHIQSRLAGGRPFLRTVADAGGLPAPGAGGAGRPAAGKGHPVDGDGGGVLSVRMGEVEKRLRRAERELVIMAEIQACHLQQMLARSPPQHPEEEAMQIKMGRERFRHALRRIRNAVRAERSFLAGVLDAVRPTEREFEKGLEEGEKTDAGGR